MRTLIRIAGVAAAIAVCVPTAGHTQLGSIADKVKKHVVKGSNGPVEQGSPDAPPYDKRMLQLTPSVLDQLAKGLAAEASERAQVQKEIAAIPTREQYQQCATQLAMGADGLKYRQQVAQDPSNAQKHLLEFQAVITQKCGHDPGDDSYRTQLQARPAHAGVQASGLTDEQYAMAKERVLPFCHAKGGTTYQNGAHKADSYVFSAPEADALMPRCTDLEKQLNATM